MQMFDGTTAVAYFKEISKDSVTKESVGVKY